MAQVEPGVPVRENAGVVEVGATGVGADAGGRGATHLVGGRR